MGTFPNKALYVGTRPTRSNRLTVELVPARRTFFSHLTSLAQQCLWCHAIAGRTEHLVPSCARFPAFELVLNGSVVRLGDLATVDDSGFRDFRLIPPIVKLIFFVSRLPTNRLKVLLIFFSAELLFALWSV